MKRVKKNLGLRSFAWYLVFYIGFALCGGSVTQAAGNPVRIEVDLNRAYAINGHPEIQKNIFGVTAYNGFPDDRGSADTEVLRHLQEYRAIVQRAGIPMLGFPGRIDWVCPATRPEDGIAGIERFYASEEALRRINTPGANYMYGSILPAARKLGIEPMMYLLGGPTWIMEYTFGGADLGNGIIPYKKDYELYAALCANYVAFLKKRVDPELRFVHIGNEHNTYYFRADKGGADYGALFDTVARAIHAKCPDVMVGGPVLCWPPAFPPKQEGFPNWYTWEGWTIPFLNVADDSLDFFDYHHYYNDEKRDVNSKSMTAEALEEMVLIANEMVIRKGKQIPIMITEGNVNLSIPSDVEWSDTSLHWEKRTLPMERILMGYLEHPDKIISHQIHDLGFSSYRLIGSESDRLATEQNPTYWLYWIWRNYRGNRLVTTGTDANVKVLGGWNGNKAVAMVFNDQNTAQDVTVLFHGGPAHTSADVSWECIYLDKKAKKTVRGSGIGDTFTAPPYSTYAVQCNLPEDIKPENISKRLEFFGQSVMNEFAVDENLHASLPVNVNVPAGALTGAKTARVRVGLLGSVPGDRILMTLGNETYPLESCVYFQEIPLRKFPGAGTNTLGFKLVELDGKHRIMVSWVTLVIEQ